MVQILVRKLPDHVKSALKLRAARRGVSMEAEARDILIREVTENTLARALDQQGLGSMARGLFAEIGFADGEFVRSGLKGRTIDFDSDPTR